MPIVFLSHSSLPRNKWLLRVVNHEISFQTENLIKKISLFFTLCLNFQQITLYVLRLCLCWFCVYSLYFCVWYEVVLKLFLARYCWSVFVELSLYQFDQSKKALEHCWRYKLTRHMLTFIISLIFMYTTHFVSYFRTSIVLLYTF